jgi:uncharacterized protein YlxW (UPF0749 family)
VVAPPSLQDTPSGEVLADGQRLSPPYVIDAIGEPRTLATALDFTGGFVSEVRGVGGKVVVRELDSVEITSVRRPKAPRYAEPGATR